MKYATQKMWHKIAAKIKSVFGGSYKDALREARLIVKTNILSFIRFTKKSGEETDRLVSKDWASFSPPKGGEAKKEGLKIFADIEKWIEFGERCIISCYDYTVL